MNTEEIDAKIKEVQQEIKARENALAENDKVRRLLAIEVIEFRGQLKLLNSMLK